MVQASYIMFICLKSYYQSSSVSLQTYDTIELDTKPVCTIINSGKLNVINMRPVMI